MPLLFQSNPGSKRHGNPERLVPQIIESLATAITWEEIEEIIFAHLDLKEEVWQQLHPNEELRERIKALKTQAKTLRIDPNCSSLVGLTVYLDAGEYHSAGTGIVECDRGYGNLRVLEVRMPNHTVTVVQIFEARLVNHQPTAARPST